MAVGNREARRRRSEGPAESIPAERVVDIVSGRGAKLIRSKAAAAAARRCGFQSADREDLIQSLTLHLWRRAVCFNPGRGDWSTFCTVVVDRRLKAILQRKRRALLNRFDRLDGEVDRDRRRRSADSLAAAELALDVESVVSRLPAALQDVCRRLQFDSPTEVARDLGIPRQTLVDRLRRLARDFHMFYPGKRQSAP